MGLSGSRQRRRSDRMSSQPERREEDDSSEGEQQDMARVLTYLLRSGHIQMFQRSPPDSDEEEDDAEQDEDENPTHIKDHELSTEILVNSGQLSTSGKRRTTNLPYLLHQREIGRGRAGGFSHGDRCLAYHSFLPNSMKRMGPFGNKLFCGQFSASGNLFFSACQDHSIRIFDTSKSEFALQKTIAARDVGWSILDVAISPDGHYLIYSSWSDYIHLCNIHGETVTHSALPLNPGNHTFCVFSLSFSADNTEILAGSNDGCLYLYNRPQDEKDKRIMAHEDDVNTVKFADSSSHVLFSGGDDGLVKVWDRRDLNENHPRPVGQFGGHGDGITYIDTKGDGRYLLSNSKDQTIKLWDMRRFSSERGLKATKAAVSRQHWDYRWQSVPRTNKKRGRLSGDTSVMTYRGHVVQSTLIRAQFSPYASTGQRYIVSGCATGSAVVYDVVTGEIVGRSPEHRNVVRDVAWHPYLPRIVTSSWDTELGVWDYSGEEPVAPETQQKKRKVSTRRRGFRPSRRGILSMDDDSDEDDDAVDQLLA